MGTESFFCAHESDLRMLSAFSLLLRTRYGPASLLPVPSINVLLGHNSSSSSDPYTRITQQPPEVVESLADTLELRAAEAQQTLLRERVLAGTSGSVLEVGSGTGAVSRHLAKLPGIKSVVGVDPSPLLVERAQKLGGGPDYSVACGTKLPLGKESIDTAVLWTTLMHVPKIQQAEVLAEIWRVLRPGGQLVVFDNDMEGWSLTNGKFDVFKVIMEHFIHSWGVDPRLMRDLPAILSQSGFSAISPLSIHTLVDSSASSYGYRVATRAVDLYETSGKGGSALATGLRMELERRVQEENFACILSYGSVKATK